MRDHQDQVLFRRQIQQFPGLAGPEHERSLAQDMLSCEESPFDIVVVRKVRGGHIDGIAGPEKILERLCLHLDAFATAEFAALVFVCRICRRELDVLDQPGFICETACDVAGPDHADPKRILVPEHCAGHTFSARQIDHLAILLKVVELSFPVRTDREDIHVVPDDIADLLPVEFLEDDLVRIAAVPDGLDPGHEAVVGVDLAPLDVEIVGRDTDYQIISKFFRPSQEVCVTLMEKVEGAVCDDFLHRIVF